MSCEYKVSMLTFRFFQNSQKDILLKTKKCQKIAISRSKLKKSAIDQLLTVRSQNLRNTKSRLHELPLLERSIAVQWACFFFLGFVLF